ncbi:MAG: right-handed parallel beta-helix repeat-containing protein [Planctomycetes bacterium]|nr:right-handed parallel beta-helix repeat-containing protein [Planctomycetota bacterium]
MESTDRFRSLAARTSVLFTLTVCCDAQSILFVDDDAPAGGDGSSWTSALSDLEVALQAADASLGTVVEIHVAAGTYRPSFRSDPQEPRSSSFFLRNQLALRGGYAGDPSQPDLRDYVAYPSTLSGDIGAAGVATDNAWHVVRAMSAVDATSVLEGFVVCDGRADRSEDRGAGLHLSGDPSIVDCHITRNFASFEGAAVHSWGDGQFIRCTIEDNVTGGGDGGAVRIQGTLLFSECVFRGNTSVVRGGAVSATNCIPTFGDCVFEENEGGVGGAIWGSNVRLTIERCRFVSNRAQGAGAISATGQWCKLEASEFVDNDSASHAGAAALGHDAIDVVGCRFLNNRATGDGGALVIGYGSARVTDCIFAGNVAANGAACFDYGSATSYTNCTIAANIATTGLGGGLHLQGPMSVSNSILWMNADSAGSTETSQVRVVSGSLSISNSCVQGWTGSLGGVANIGADPSFADPDGFDDLPGTLDDDWRPIAGSACVDSGDASKLPGDVLDLDGDGDTSEPLPRDIDAKPRVLLSNVDRGAYELALDGPSTYCTAKANSLGCVPRIGCSGYPALSGFDDFVLYANHVLSQKPGLVAWGFAPNGTAFGGGTLCVRQPMLRLPAQSSGGPFSPSDCSGAYAAPMTHAYLIANGAVAGTTAFAQFWMRDPGFAPYQAIGLTDGLAFTVYP